MPDLSTAALSPASTEGMSYPEQVGFPDKINDAV
jgi:hypothetical protein